jgi:hypothetical protein
MGTLNFEWLDKNIQEAMKARNTKLLDEEKGEYVEVDEGILQGLQQVPCVSCKRS